MPDDNACQPKTLAEAIEIIKDLEYSIKLLSDRNIALTDTIHDQASELQFAQWDIDDMEIELYRLSLGSAE